MRTSVLTAVLVGLGILGLIATTALGVGTTGQIFGTVTDPSGAAVPDAKVTVTSVATNESRTVTTAAGGEYEVPNLPPGKYQVTVEKQGFRKVVHENVIVQVAVPTRVNSQLELGQITETVTVTESAAKVESSNIALGGTVSTDLLGGLPTVGRNYLDFVLTVPGVVASSDRFGTPSVNGQRTQANNFLIEGVDNNDLPLNTPLAQPSPDSLAEFRVITSTINPEYGRNSGSIVNAIAKSGTNEFHGDVFEYYRGKGFNSNTYFNNLAQVPKANFNRNVWGATAGGPVYFPSVYNGRNKSFWFFSYQGTHQITPLNVATQRVFTAAERDLNNTGFADWSAACRRGTAGTCFSDRTRRSSQPFLDETRTLRPAGTLFSTLWPNGRIPTANFDPIARNILAGFPNLNVPGIPLPNAPGTCGTGVTTCNFIASYATPLKNYQVSVKGDHDFTRNSRLSGYYFRQTSSSTNQIPFTGATVPGFGDHQLSVISRASVTHTHFFTPNVSNEARIGWNRLRFAAVLPNNVFDPKKIGFTGINAQDLSVASAPNFVIAQGWFDYGFSRNGPQPRTDETFQYTDNLSWIRGKHSFKLGFDIRQQRITNPFFFAHNGVFQCNGSSSGFFGGRSTGNAGLDFMLNNCEIYFQSSPGRNNARSNGYYVYGQDVSRLTKTFTLTWGLGWALEQPYDQLAGNLLAFRPGQQSVVVPPGPGGVPGGAPLGLLYKGDPGIPRGTIPLRKFNFAPRVGIAWSPSTNAPGLRFLTGGPGKFSIRAGYGVYYNIIEEETNLQFLLTFPISLFKVTLLPNLANPFQARAVFGTSPNGFPFTPPPPGTPVDFSDTLPLNISVLDPNQRVPYAQSWHLTIERELRSQTKLSVGYVGSKGTNLVTTEEIFDTAGRAALAPIPDLGNPDIWQSVGLQQTNNNSSYHGLQVSVEKFQSHGLYFKLAYTLGKSLDTNSGFEDTSNTPRNHKRDRGLSVFDARQRLVLTSLWDIPGPKTGVLGRIAGGWSFSGITTFQSGFPVSIFSGSNDCDDAVTISFFGTWCRPDLVGTVVRSDPRSSSNQRFFNANAFKNPTASGTGTLPELGNSPRAFFHGPGINNWDVAILKAIKIDERRHLQLRFEFFNAYNHAQFTFGSTTGDVDSSNFGRATGTRTIQGAQRVIQLAGKFFW